MAHAAEHPGVPVPRQEVVRAMAGQLLERGKTPDVVVVLLRNQGIPERAALEAVRPEKERGGSS